jgi:MFS family permease
MHQYLYQIRRFTREARLFLIALVIFALATAVPGVFFNLYLQALGFDRAFLGVVAAAGQLGGAIFSLPAAGLLDVLGRRRAMLIGAGSSILCTCATLLTTQGWLIVATQAISGCGGVLYALAVVPLLAESSTTVERTALFSTAEGLTTLGLFLGSLVAGGLPVLVAPWLNSNPESALVYRWVMLGAQAFRAMGLLPLALIHDHATALPPGIPRRRTISYFDPRVLLRLETPIWRLVLPILVCYIAGSLIFPFLNVYLKERFNASDAAIGVVLGTINLAIGVCTLLGPLVVQALGRVQAVVLGAIVSAVSLVLVLLGGPFAFIAILVIVRAGLFNMTLPLYRAYVIDRTPPYEYAVVNLIYSTSANVGPTIGPPISGYVQDRHGFAPLFAAAVALYTVAAGLFYWAAGARSGVRRETYEYRGRGTEGGQPGRQ